MRYPRVVLAGTNSSVGKTTVALGIMLALKKRNLKVQPFKVGPDYIDPTYHTQATGRACRNLDSWLLSPDTILELFERQAIKSDVSIIEGVMGLYDGVSDRSEKGSTALLSKILRCPVILIVDAHSLSRSAGAIVLGYQKFDKEVRIVGVILNNIGSSTHYQWAKNSIEEKTGIPVLGFLPRDKNLHLPERHLGLIPTQEKELLQRSLCDRLAGLVDKNIDLDKVLKISQSARALPKFEKEIFVTKSPSDKVTIALTLDKAFSFYYQDNLDILRSLGAEIMEFSPLEDKRLPQGIDGLYLGGGFPEIFACPLSKNLELKNQIRKLAEEGLPVYAECGGLMYLMEELVDFKEGIFPMVGVFSGTVKMAAKLHSLGYVEMETVKNNILSHKGERNRGHVFHWSYLAAIPKDICFAYRMRNSKQELLLDGLIRGNVLASYVHLHFASNVSFAKRFIESCREYKLSRRE
ncbi:cobyrinate a,c-diamide synthase [Candidatus Hakubella thermalkaliphila]|nr:cobyrinate a,c-diamide synthase [Candidatus Hakubella thermalkaliphila]